MALFMNENHRLSFEENLNNFSENQQSNPEYLAVLYIISSNPELLWKMSPYFKRDGFDVTSMFDEQDFSSGFYDLALLASNLFNSGSDVTPIDLIGSLSDENFQVAMNAIYIRKTGSV